MASFGIRNLKDHTDLVGLASFIQVEMIIFRYNEFPLLMELLKLSKDENESNTD